MTIPKALDLNRDGWNDEVVKVVWSHQHSMLNSGSLGEIVERFRAEARIQRRHDETNALAQAYSSTQQTMLLSRLLVTSWKLTAPACLGLAACRTRYGNPANTQATVGLTTHPDTGVTGQAWWLLGEAILLAERPFGAVATLLNAITGDQRDKDRYHEADTRVPLLLAFGRTDHLKDADRLTLRYDAPSDVPQGLLGTRFLLARVGHEHRLGHIGEVLGTLKAMETRLGATPGSGVLHRGLLIIRTGYLDD